MGVRIVTGTCSPAHNQMESLDFRIFLHLATKKVPTRVASPSYSLSSFSIPGVNAPGFFILFPLVKGKKNPSSMLTCMSKGGWYWYSVTELKKSISHRQMRLPNLSILDHHKINSTPLLIYTRPSMVRNSCIGPCSPGAVEDGPRGVTNTRLLSYNMLLGGSPGGRTTVRSR